MKKFMSIYLALTISTLLLLSAGSLEKIQATEITSTESFIALTPYGVPEAHDTDSTKRKHPAIFWGYDQDGSVTFADGTNQSAFNASCIPTVVMIPVQAEDTSTIGYHVHEKTVTNTAFTYEVRQNSNGTVTDVTATVGVYWVAFGWK